MENNFEQQKQIMIKDHLKGRDIDDVRVLKAMKDVPREEFVPPKYKDQAYADHAIPIGQGQTISQPYIVAIMCQLLELEGDERVLDIGTGSGYHAAILSKLAKEVISLEIIPKLAEKARKTLEKLDYANVTVVEKNGKQGYPPKAPYQGIVSAAAAKSIPQAWKNQLDDGGILVTPVEGVVQKLLKIRKEDDKFKRETISYVRFVLLK